MKHSIDLRWIGDTVAKGRPRFTTRNGRSFAFTDAKTRSAEKHLSQWFAFNCAIKNFRPLVVPCGFDLVIVRPMPKSPKFKDWPGVRPDCDNFVKLIMDSANGVIWDDDSLVCKMNIEKVYPGPLRLVPGFILKAYEL